MIGLLWKGGLPVLALSCLFYVAPSDDVTEEDTGAAPGGALTGNLVSTEKVRTRGTTSEADLVIWLEPTEGEVVMVPEGSEAAKAHVKQIKREFVPHVLTVQCGAVVEFDNSDSIRHNILANDSCCKVDRDLEEGSVLEVPFNEPGVASILCRLHPEMTMYVVTVPSAHYTQARLDRAKNEAGEKIYQAEYSIEAIPPGMYTLHVWSKKLEARKLPVEIVKGEATVLDVNW